MLIKCPFLRLLKFTSTPRRPHIVLAVFQVITCRVLLHFTLSFLFQTPLTIPSPRQYHNPHLDNTTPRHHYCHCPCHTHHCWCNNSTPSYLLQLDADLETDIFLFRSPNRNSMPITSYDRTRNIADLRSSLGALDSRSFLFDDEEPSALPTKSANQTSPPDTKSYLVHTADGFPKLIRREDNSELLSGSSAALDLALTHLSNGEQHVSDRATGSRHRISLPPPSLSSSSIAPLNSILANAHDVKPTANTRRSLEVKFTAETKRPLLMASPTPGMPNGIGKGHSSYSTNDIPTLKSIDQENSGGVPLTSPSIQPNVNDDHGIARDLTSHNRDRTFSDGTSNNNTQRQSLEFASTTASHQVHDGFASPQVGLPGNNAHGHAQNHEANLAQQFGTANMYGQPSYHGGYGMHTLNNGFNNMSIAGQFPAHSAPWPNQAPSFQSPGYGGYHQYQQGSQVASGANRYSDGTRSNPQQRREQGEDLYAQISIPDVAGQIYGLCKDQHGCRFLQRKLKEQKESDILIIFDEVKDHFQELMVDPFGNYLCQRLVENCSDEQRTVLVQNVVPAMTTIALNQHGTRALQRMIELVSTQEQTNMLIEGLRFDVVQLIQDLNGNHVMQKCLNHLSAQDAQFIFDAVGANCVAVGTHRHGCCVLQRCVDHASGAQKGDLVNSIVANAFGLVQDPFGNYVVQYILDLSEPCFTEPLCQAFYGNISFLSKQKFSSNVMEKCIRCASPETRRVLISEIISPSEIERLLRDSFANYVVQTAMEFADEETKILIIETLRPMMPNIRNTPHGRRIQSKIQDYDNGGVGAITNANMQSLAGPSNVANGNMHHSQPMNAPPTGRGNRMGMVGAPPQWTNGNSLGGATGSFGGGDVAAGAPRNQAFNMLNGVSNYSNGLGSYQNGGQNHLNGGQNFSNGGHNYPNGHNFSNGGQNPNGAYGGPGSQGFSHPRPPYGHF